MIWHERMGRGVKAVILAGGRGTRLFRGNGAAPPKPMVRDRRRPILWHILKIYEAHGITDFVICLGYRGWQIKGVLPQLRAALFGHRGRCGDRRGQRCCAARDRALARGADPTPAKRAQTGGRLARVAHLLRGGAGVLPDLWLRLGDVDPYTGKHRLSPRPCVARATVNRRCAARPVWRAAARTAHERSPPSSRNRRAMSGLINGGFFVLSPAVLDRIAGDATSLEQEALARAGA